MPCNTNRYFTFIIQNEPMNTRFKKKRQIFDIAVTAVSAMVSVGVMLYGVAHFGLRESWPELVLNTFYITCLVMMWMYFFNRLDTQRFNYWSSLCVGVSVLLRDILFPPPLAYYPIHLATLTLSVMLVLMLTFFYARKQWQTYSKFNLWMVFVVDMVIAVLYNIDIYLEPANQYTDYMLTEIWIRPAITYGLVACFITETDSFTNNEVADTQQSPANGVGE